MRTILLALAVLATPALAQTSPEGSESPQTAADAGIDAALVGEWTLQTVVDNGEIGAYGVEIQAMTCDFSADGKARVSVMAVQDGDTMSRQREFEFETEDGQIVTKKEEEGMSYRVLDSGLLELIDGRGLVIHFVRVGA